MITINEQGDFTKGEFEYYRKKLIREGFKSGSYDGDFVKSEKETFKYGDYEFVFSHKFHLSVGIKRNSFYSFYVMVKGEETKDSFKLIRRILDFFNKHIFKEGNQGRSNGITFWRLDKDSEKQIDDILEKIKKVPLFIKKLRSLTPKQGGRF